jgi:hypothetical protein
MYLGLCAARTWERHFLNSFTLLQNYKGGRVLFDKYQREISIKDDIRYSKQPGHAVDLYIEDGTPITNFKKCLASKITKDHLTQSPEQKVILFC